MKLEKRVQKLPVLRTTSAKRAGSRLKTKCRGIVKKEYGKAGYSFREDRFKKVVFYSSRDGGMVSTVSLIVDSPKGLPLDEIYKREVEKYRRNGKKVAEVVKLATEGHENSSSVGFRVRALLQLF